MANKTCPSETEEEIALSDYCDARGLQHWHVPQETYTTSWKQKAKNKAQGVRVGTSDHWVVVPFGEKSSILLVFELKKQFGNTPTDEQLGFVKGLDRIANVYATVCYGANEAIKIIEEMQDGNFSTLAKCNDRVDNFIKNRELEFYPNSYHVKSRKIKKNQAKTVKIGKNDLPY